MDLDDDTLRLMALKAPRSIPVGKLGRTLRLLEGADRRAFMDEICRRRPKNEGQRRELLALALRHHFGGVGFIDMLDGFPKRPS